MQKAIVMTTRVDLNRVHRNVEVVDAPNGDNLEFFYKHIGCHIVDVAYSPCGDMFVDDEGLLKSDIPVFTYQEGLDLAGNIVVTAGVDDGGKTLWFDDVDKINEVIDYLEQGDLRGVTR